MKILFLTEGGKQKGLGHIARCFALSEAIKEHVSGAEMSFMYEGETFIKAMLKDVPMDIVINEWQKDVQGTIEYAGDFHLLIIDSYVAGRELYEGLSKSVFGNILMIDDNNRIRYPQGIVLNSSVNAIALNYSMESNIRYLIGEKYIVLRKDFWTIPEKEIREKPKKILLTFGGSEIAKGLTARLVNLLSEMSELEVSVVGSNGGKFTAGEMVSIMLESDICISGGGQTLNELARVGLPTVAVGLVDNQKYNLKGFIEKGFIEYAGWGNDLGLDMKIMKCIDALSSVDERKKRSAIGKKIVNGKGAENVIKAFIDREAFRGEKSLD